MSLLKYFTNKTTIFKTSDTYTLEKPEYVPDVVFNDINGNKIILIQEGEAWSVEVKDTLNNITYVKNSNGY